LPDRRFDPLDFRAELREPPLPLEEDLLDRRWLILRLRPPRPDLALELVPLRAARAPLAREPARPLALPALRLADFALRRPARDLLEAELFPARRDVPPEVDLFDLRIPIASLAVVVMGLPVAAAFPASAPATPPTTAPTGPATLPSIAPVAAPAAGFEMGGITMFSLDCCSAD
jgi:hypothetical protein